MEQRKQSSAGSLDKDDDDPVARSIALAEEVEKAKDAHRKRKKRVSRPDIARQAIERNANILHQQNALKAPSKHHPIPWESSWPELVDFYSHHSPDYSGIGLYNPDVVYTSAHAQLALANPVNFTVQALISESARLNNRAPKNKLLWLKGMTIQLINRSLRDPEVPLLSHVASISALAAHDTMFGDVQHATVHLQGLKRIIDRYGGFAVLKQQQALEIRNLMCWIDSLRAYIAGDEANGRIFHLDWPIARVTHPVHQALLPRNSHIPTVRMRILLIVSLGGPHVKIMEIMTAIDRLAYATLTAPYTEPVTPKEARTKAAYFEDLLLQMGQLGPEFRLNQPLFSTYDKENYNIVFETLRRCALVLVSYFNSIVTGRVELAEAKLDHNVMSFYMLDISRLCRDHPVLGLWALCICGPHTSAHFNGAWSFELLIGTARRLHIASLGDLMMHLKKVHLSGPLMFEKLRDLWGKIESTVMMTGPATGLATMMEASVISPIGSGSGSGSLGRSGTSTPMTSQTMSVDNAGGQGYGSEKKSDVLIKMEVPSGVLA